MARTKYTPKKERKERKVLWLKKDQEEIAARGRRPPSPVHHPSPAKKPSPAREVEKMVEEAERWVEEARWLEDMGRLPSLSPTWQLAQMAAEARPSTLGEEPVKRKLCPTMGGKAPGRSSSRLEKLKRPGSTSLAQLLFRRSGSSKRAPSSLSGNSPSHG